MTDRFNDMSLEELLDALRADGWSVAVHNDYTITVQRDNYSNPEPKRFGTFWLFTHECGVFVKGEAPMDKEAVLLCAKAAHKIFAPSP